jgi:hypothetical protein
MKIRNNIILANSGFHQLSSLWHFDNMIDNSIREYLQISIGEI